MDHNNIENSITTELSYVSSDLNVNMNYLKEKYSFSKCSDIIIRPFEINISNNKIKAFLIGIDGMIDSTSVNNFILTPLMMISSKFYCSNDKLGDFIYNILLPQNSVEKASNFSEIFEAVNMGDCAIFIDSLNYAFTIDVKGFKQRSIESPSSEIIIRGSQEAFVENLRANTSILRRLVNSENLVIEKTTVGKITKTQVAIAYVRDIVNPDLVTEVSKRINNLDIDYLLSSGQLEQFIQDSPKSLFPQILATERADNAVNHLMEGRAVAIVNGSPYALIMPSVFTDFLSSPEDLNLKFQFANLGKIVRLCSIFLALLLPGLYIAITNYHQELVPTELLFTITAARESVPFPTLIEILLMEFSFELIREAGLRVPSPLGSTIGIVGGLILGDAAVSASLVSPVLIIIVAITGICSFSMPDISLNYTFRIYRFAYIALGYIGGFLGIGFGLFIQLISMCSLKSFNADYLSPYPLQKNKNSISSYFVLPIWKRDRNSTIAKAKKKFSQAKISMKWRYMK